MSLINGSSLDEPKQGSLVTKEQQQPEISTDARPKALFPYRLYELLESAKTDGFEDIISWLPCGTAFKIRNVEAFKDTILWRHFRLRNYKSFQRNVNLYEIKQGGGLGAMSK